MARSEMAGYSFLVIKNHILYFEKVLLETTFVSQQLHKFILWL